MLTGIISYIRRRMRRRTQKSISKHDLEEYMRIEGVLYGDLFPPDLPIEHPKQRE